MIEFMSHEWWAFFFRWLHIIAGIMWIGHLWYFNFTQTPTMPKIPAELKPGVSKYILPEALFWFRWGALATIVLGLILAWMLGELGGTIRLGIGDKSAHLTALGFGMWLGTIMFLNVWGIIWPNQKKNIGLVECTPEQKAKAARTAALASRVNTLLSIPMLYCMASVHVY